MALDVAITSIVEARDAVSSIVNAQPAASAQDQHLAALHADQVNFIHGARCQADATAAEVRGHRRHYRMSVWQGSRSAKDTSAFRDLPVHRPLT